MNEELMALMRMAMLNELRVKYQEDILEKIFVDAKRYRHIRDTGSGKIQGCGGEGICGEQLDKVVDTQIKACEITKELTQVRVV